jgi:hypothetical protein
MSNHHEYCRVWDKFHPYDCPDCALLSAVVDKMQIDFETELDKAIEEAESVAYDNGYAEGQAFAEIEAQDELDRLTSVIDAEVDRASEVGYNQGYSDGRLARENLYA